MSKSELSARSGVSRSLIDDYLKGRSQPSVAQLARLGDGAGHRLSLAWKRRDTEIPRWARPNLEMLPPPRTIDERAKLLERVVPVAMAQRRRVRGDLEFPPFRTLVKSGSR